jgi:hypothetical protein
MAKTYTTWQVLKLLEMHRYDDEPWEFEAPYVHMNHSKNIARGGLHKVEFIAVAVGGGSALVPALFRSDWVRTKPVKQKRERTKIGDVTVKERNVTFGNTMAFIELPDGDYELVAVKK